MQPDQQPQSTLPSDAAGQNIAPVEDLGSMPRDYFHPIVDQPKHTMSAKHVAVTLIAVLLVSLLAVGVMLAVALIPAKQLAQKPAAQKQSSTATRTSLTAKQTIDHVKVYFKGTAAAKSPIMTPVMAPGKAFYTVIPDVAPLTSVAGEVTPDKSSAQLASIVKSMEYDTFKKREFQDGVNGTDYLADYTRDDTVCQVAVTKPKDANHWFEVRCLDMVQYYDYATTQEPLTARYSSITSTASQYGFVGKPVTIPSKTAGYTLAEIPVSTVIDQRMSALNNRAMFYQSPDKLWHYVIDHTDGIVPECEQFTTIDLRTAYVGQRCRNIAKAGVLDTVVLSKR